ncbi:MAG: ABC transporter ATP-binding protein [Campylobacter sputorum]|uniref:ABC transporter ATP-binding protein n=1 Tax=Campylobacter sputorum TaxID=206 RepID=UPI000B76EF47|nr:ABC transporter ATP-binding protein [Campylobacter sputorum]ASM35990.1 metal ion ABC transporter, ATP-binding protein [Campylobacter sputorum bv. faecalis CCUG 20703]ASM37670.1 metal ion ABC transporter, ATP-binding protein [Campylobacter sputorum bv. paraureolyticus LMG 11764]MDY6120206.1 ABC transporter ATP-binding protein [Campylobacter sputorum]
MIKVNNLSFSYKDAQILYDISFSVGKNRLCAILGSNGSGKSTIFSSIMNFIRPKSGEIYINDEFSLDKNPAWMSQRIAFVSQDNLGVFGFSVLEIVLMARTRFMSGIKHSKKDISAAKNALNLVGAYHLKDKIITNLSGGERQLVFIARAIAQNTPIILLDEPTSALDFKNQILFWQIVKKISQDTTILVSTHDPNHALWFCDDMVGIKKGKVVVSGEIKEKLNDENLYLIYEKECEILKSKKTKFILPLVGR